MSSDVGICNSALAKIGEVDFITSLTQNHKFAKLCNKFYAPIRLKLLRGHEWNFAIKRQKLAQSATTPISEFDFQYPFPAGWVRTVAVHSNDAGVGTLEYRLEAQKVLTNANEVWMEFVADVTDANIMTADFREALADDIASQLAIPIAQSRTLKVELREAAKSTLRRAKSSDAIENSPRQIPEGSWVTDRF